jgi:hypothetical protein
MTPRCSREGSPGEFHGGKFAPCLGGSDGGSEGAEGGPVTCHLFPCRRGRSRASTPARALAPVGPLGVVPGGIDHAQFAVFRGRNREIYRVGLEKRRNVRGLHGARRRGGGSGPNIPSESAFRPTLILRIDPPLFRLHPPGGSGGYAPKCSRDASRGALCCQAVQNGARPAVTCHVG